MKATKVSLVSALLICAALAAPQSTELFQGVVTPPQCNCPPMNATSALVTAEIPQGRAFTGNCVVGWCETVLAGMHQVQNTFAIPEGECLDDIKVLVTYTGSIDVQCGPGNECPTMSVGVAGWEWRPDFNPCFEESDPEDPGVEA